MKSSKISVGMALSRNYDKVSLEVLDEPVEYETDEGFSVEVRRIFKRLREEIELEFQNVQGKK